MSLITDVLGDPDTATMLWNKARTSAGDPQTRWLAAFQEIDITPDINGAKPELQGYFGASRRPETIESKLKVQVLLLEDGYHQRSLFVGADIFGFGPELVEAVRAEAALWGIRPECIILNASHTHYGPGTVSHAIPGLGGLDIEFTRRVCAAITNALPRLYQDLSPSELSWSRCEAQVGFNRRQNVDGRIEMQPNLDGHYKRDAYLTRSPRRWWSLFNGQPWMSPDRFGSSSGY